MGVKFTRTKDPQAVSLMETGQKREERAGQGTGSRNSPFTSRSLSVSLCYPLSPSVLLAFNLNLPQERTRESFARRATRLERDASPDAEGSRGVRRDSSSAREFRALEFKR